MAFMLKRKLTAKELLSRYPIHVGMMARTGEAMCYCTKCDYSWYDCIEDITNLHCMNCDNHQACSTY